WESRIVGRRTIKGLGQSPVHHQRFAIVTQHHVARLEVTVKNSAAVSIGYRIADVEEPAEQLPELEVVPPVGRAICSLARPSVETLDGILQAIATYEAHDVKGAAVAEVAQSIHRHNARMFQVTGDFGLPKESASRIGIIGVLSLKLLECDFAAQFFVEGNVNFAQAASCMRPQDAKP